METPAGALDFLANSLRILKLGAEVPLCANAPQRHVVNLVDFDPRPRLLHRMIETPKKACATSRCRTASA